MSGTETSRGSDGSLTALASAAALLADEQRALALACLDEFDGPARIDELAEAIVRAADGPLSRDDLDAESVAARLHHVHVPKLRAHDAVTVRDDETVAPGERFPELIALLEDLLVR